MMPTAGSKLQVLTEQARQQGEHLRGQRDAANQRYLDRRRDACYDSIVKYLTTLVPQTASQGYSALSLQYSCSLERLNREPVPPFVPRVRDVDVEDQVEDQILERLNRTQGNGLFSGLLTATAAPIDPQHGHRCGDANITVNWSGQPLASDDSDPTPWQRVAAAVRQVHRGATGQTTVMPQQPVVRYAHLAIPDEPSPAEV